MCPNLLPWKTAINDQNIHFQIRRRFGILRHNGHIACNHFGIEILPPTLPAAQCCRSISNTGKALQDRAFARTVSTDKCRNFTLHNLQIQPSDDISRIIGKALFFGFQYHYALPNAPFTSANKENTVHRSSRKKYPLEIPPEPRGYAPMCLPKALK